MVYRLFRNWRTNKLAERGYALLEEWSFEEALGVSAQLESRGYSAAFDIGAQALAALERHEEAVQYLEHGVREAPSAWPNWQLLGSLRSDLGDFEGADSAYREALKHAPPPANSIRINQAILAYRSGRPRDGLSLLSPLSPSTSTEAVVIARVKTTCLVATDEAPAAIELARTTLDKLASSGADDSELAVLCNALGRALLESAASSEEIEACAFEALRFNPSNESALALLRDSQSLYSPDSQYFRLLLRGDATGHGQVPGNPDSYYVTYDVVASNPEEAQEFASAIDSRDVGSRLTLEELELIEPRPSDPKGVYSFTGRAYFRSD